MSPRVGFYPTIYLSVAGQSMHHLATKNIAGQHEWDKRKSRVAHYSCQWHAEFVRVIFFIRSTSLIGHFSVIRFSRSFSQPSNTRSYSPRHMFNHNMFILAYTRRISFPRADLLIPLIDDLASLRIFCAPFIRVNCSLLFHTYSIINNNLLLLLLYNNLK